MALDKMPHRREPQGGSARTHACAAMEGVGQSSRPHRGAASALSQEIGSAQLSSYSHQHGDRTQGARRHQIDQMSRERGDGSERNSACTAQRHTGGCSVSPNCNYFVIAIWGTVFENSRKARAGRGVVAASVCRPARRVRSRVFGARPPDPGTSLGAYATL